MGQDNSREEAEQSAQTTAGGADCSRSTDFPSATPRVASVPLAGIEGFQVVRLLPYSPAHKGGLVPFFDIITAVDRVLLNTNETQALQFFKSYVANHRNQLVCFTTFNLYTRAYRDVSCIPSDDWGGGGLLGCSIEWTRADACPERCVHVVDVLEGSPAAYSTELKANRDYIIGMQTAQDALITLIKSQKDFYSRLEAWRDEQRWAQERKQRFPSEAVEVPHVLLLLVYNSESNTVGEVEVEMGTNPEAALGISVATGLLHIIPSVSDSHDLTAGASLPVMNKFTSAHSGIAVPASVQQREQLPNESCPASAAEGSAPCLQEPPQELSAPSEYPPYSLFSEEAHAMHPHPQWLQPQHQLTSGVPYPMPPPTSHNIVPPPRDGEAGEAAAAERGQEPFSPFSNGALPEYSGLEGSPLPCAPAVAVEHDMGQHALMTEQSPSSLHPPQSHLPQLYPPQAGSAIAPAHVNGFHSHAAAPAMNPLPAPLQQQRLTAMPMFSSQRMPPPLHFPVFPGAAAAKRAPT
ncbi:hypothetical protein JIQ42_02044 [Leishmania sp. Namibia]|uniref:hypothetical protein n=1 Tax=Leishmania sp. Namibia TaxID=2802991 RepID=UPI001B54D545|nr:hypothetical protein JIQ42_02044 [Leishmania sp. Namibia]